LFAYASGIFQAWDSPAIAIGGHDDHVHVLFVLNKNHALAKVVEEVKKSSSKWIKTLGARWSKFAWQNGYGAFSVSESNVSSVRRYIERRPDHHRRITFQDEFRQLLVRHCLAIDERYIWS
jgi:REP element-mobilizing transposase RayT